MLALSDSLIELNSSMQQIPPSAKTRAPASSCHSPPATYEKCEVKWETIHIVTIVGFGLGLKLLTIAAETVRPADVEPTPVVNTDRGLTAAANLSSWDLAVPGSPTSKR